MYEERFGLKSNPFRTALQGPGVFIGPRQATAMSALQKGLAGIENVVTVSGPAGVGKTTIVTRALETNKAHQLVAWIGRMRLAPDEVLDLLLAGFGVGRQPPSMVQKFAAFQRLLNDRAKKNIRVVIVIEDALRVGNDALLELEALTAADTGLAGGANLILMGPPEIERRLQLPEFGRLKQRARLGQKISPFNPPETMGYLKHCMRTAGSDFDKVFDVDAASMFYRCSGGVPRVINSLCDSVLAAADDQKLDRICADIVLSVARDVYGVEPSSELADSTVSTHAKTDLTENSTREESTDCDVEITASALIVSGNDDSIVESPAAASNSPKSAGGNSHTGATAAAATAMVSETGDYPELPRAVAELIAQHARSSVPDEMKTAAPETEADEPSIDMPDLSDLVDVDDIADDALIADTGMNVPPEFRPDPDMEIQASQLVRRDTDARRVADVDDQLPTLSVAMRVEIEADDDADLPVLSSIDESDELPVIDAESLLRIESTAVDLRALPANETMDVPVLESKNQAVPENKIAPSVRVSQKAEPFVASPMRQAPPEKKADITTKSAKPGTPDAEKFKPVPDLDALEAAISAARRSEPMPRPARTPEPVASETRTAENDRRAAPVKPSAPSRSPKQPEITLDQVLEDQRKEGRKLDEMAAELANVTSLEDISDIMAETLFGEEFTQFAADALLNPASSGSLPGHVDVVASPIAGNGKAMETPANDSINEESPLVLDLEKSMITPQIKVEAEIVMGTEPLPAKNRQSASTHPDSIDDQFRTSITQTLKALSSRGTDEVVTAVAEQGKGGGLLGKLKRTFKT